MPIYRISSMLDNNKCFICFPKYKPAEEEEAKKNDKKNRLKFPN